MKAIVTGLSLFFLFISISVLHAQQFKWVKGGGSTEDLSGYTSADWERSQFMCTDANGNIYALNIVGNSPITADSFHRSSAYGANNSILITSYNCSGQMRWAKLIGSANNLTGYGLGSDGLGHIYIAGLFPHLGGSSHALYIGYDTSIATNLYEINGVIQFDTSGHFNWIRFIGNNVLFTASNVFGNCLAIDADNNAHFFCYINSGVALSAGDTTHCGEYDLVYNTSGSLISTVRLGMDTMYFLHSAVIDPATNKLYVCGENTASSSGLADSSFAAAFGASRNLIWQYFNNSYAAVAGVTIDQSKHLHFEGDANSTFFAFNGDTVTNTHYPGYDVSLIMTTDTNGNPESIVKFDGNTSINSFGYNSITQLPNNKVAAAGGFVGTITDGTHTLTTTSTICDPFLTVIDSGGDLETLQQIYGDGANNGATTITSDKVGNIYIGGLVADSIYAGTIPAYHTVGGNTDFFVMKYGVDCSCTSMPVSHYTDTGTHTVGFTYTGTTTSIDSVKWYFGDGDSSTAATPVHTYTAAGTYHACVTVYSFCGDDIYCTNILLPCLVAPTAAFSDTGFSLIKHFTYTGTTTGIDSVVWHFGDGSRDTGNTVAHTYSVGTYTACVIAYNPCGVDSSCSSVTVINCTGIPSASFAHSGATDTISFSYTGPTSYIDSVVWHFGDGGHSTGLAASHIYPSVATFTACITVYTECGSDSACNSIVIPCVVAPVASYTVTGVTATRSFTYSGTTTAIDSIVWHFGDGSHSTGLTTSHTYSDTGIFTVCVMAYNPCGSDSACSTITISCISAPVANFTDTGTATVHFTYTGTTTGIDSVAWLYGDGSRGAGLLVTHTYAIPDTYIVCVIAYNNCGNDTVCKNVIIPCDTPIASFTDTGIVNINFTYTGSTTGIDSVVWLYGDGNRGTGNTCTHSYDTSGTYHVCVIAFTNCAVDSICRNITVTGTGVSSVLLHSIQVFPNPVTDELTVIGILENTNYKLLDVTGICLQQGVLQKGNNYISLKSLAMGIYILEMTGTDGVKDMVKIVKE